VSRRARRSTAARQPRPTPSRINREKILGNLRIAARKGDRVALVLALGEMRTLAFSPRHWEKYLTLLANPLARLADLLVIKQGERIAHLKGWKRPAPARGAPGTGRTRPGGLRSPRAPRPAPRAPRPATKPAPRAPDGVPRRQLPPATAQPTLFELG
jgi:hypothetical protein